jgi:hypothetical protein
MISIKCAKCGYVRRQEESSNCPKCSSYDGTEVVVGSKGSVFTIEKNAAMPFSLTAVEIPPQKHEEDEIPPERKVTRSGYARVSRRG